MDFLTMLKIIFQQFLVLLLDILYCLLTITSGLIMGKLIMFNVNNIVGINVQEEHRNPNQIYKKVILASIFMIFFLRFVTIPEGLKLQAWLKKKCLPVPDSVSFVIVVGKFLVMPFCYVTLVILFEGRYCYQSLNLGLIKDYFTSAFGSLDDMSRSFNYSFNRRDKNMDEAAKENYFTIILTLAFAIPIYRLLKFYWTSGKSVLTNEYQNDERELLPEKYSSEGKDKCETVTAINWRCQFYATFLELSEYFLFIGFLYAITNLSDSWELGDLCTLALYPLASAVGFFMIGLEALNRRTAKLGGTQIRVFQNMFYLLYFIPRTFMLYHKNLDDNGQIFCNDNGQMDMTNTISQDFVIFSSICVYSMWKILILCNSNSRKKGNDQKEISNEKNRICRKN